MANGIFGQDKQLSPAEYYQILAESLSGTSDDVSAGLGQMSKFMSARGDDVSRGMSGAYRGMQQVPGDVSRGMSGAYRSMQQVPGDVSRGLLGAWAEMKKSPDQVYRGTQKAMQNAGQMYDQSPLPGYMDSAQKTMGQAGNMLYDLWQDPEKAAPQAPSGPMPQQPPIDFLSGIQFDGPPQQQKPRSIASATSGAPAPQEVGGALKAAAFPNAPKNPMELIQQRLFQLQSEGLKEQRKGIKDLEKEIKDYTGKDRMDISPILAMSDMMTGTNYLSAYDSPRKRKEKAMYMKQRLQGARKDLTKSEIDLLKNQYSMLRSKGRTSQKDMSLFEKEKLKDLGKGAAQFYQKDRPQFLSNIPKIDEAIGIMEKGGKSLTGGTTDKIFGSFGLSVRDEDAYMAQQNMQSAITDTLRPTLGAQFTEAEGKRIMNLTFDPALPTHENERRARQLKKAIQQKVEFQDALYEHIGAYGSDRDFPYAKYGMSKDGSSPSSGGVKEYNGKKFKVVGDEWVEVE